MENFTFCEISLRSEDIWRYYYILVYFVISMDNDTPHHIEFCYYMRRVLAKNKNKFNGKLHSVTSRFIILHDEFTLCIKKKHRKFDENAIKRFSFSFLIIFFLTSFLCILLRNNFTSFWNFDGIKSFFKQK